MLSCFGTIKRKFRRLGERLYLIEPRSNQVEPFPTLRRIYVTADTETGTVIDDFAFISPAHHAEEVRNEELPADNFRHREQMLNYHQYLNQLNRYGRGDNCPAVSSDNAFHYDGTQNINATIIQYPQAQAPLYALQSQRRRQDEYIPRVPTEPRDHVTARQQYADFERMLGGCGSNQLPNVDMGGSQEGEIDALWGYAVICRPQ